MRLALRRSENGDNDLHALVLNQPPKALADVQDGSRRMVQDTPIKWLNVSQNQEFG